ncbi:MAG TPA: hypothetical protein VFU56_08430 [Gaiellaceae bacterium]|nr:hypothetical protein [Gaiellaceae bacterium]
MRRLFVILLASLVAVPAALAAKRAVGDGVLELKSADGRVVIGKDATPARGLLWGQMDRGKLIVVDPLPGDGNQVLVSGAERKSPPLYNDSGALVTTYWGANLHFRVTGGKYRLVFDGTGIDLTAIGTGIAYLTGDPNAVDAGYYAVDSGKWVPMPVSLVSTKPLAVTFPAAATQSP